MEEFLRYYIQYNNPQIDSFTLFWWKLSSWVPYAIFGIMFTKYYFFVVGFMNALWIMIPIAVNAVGYSLYLWIGRGMQNNSDTNHIIFWKAIIQSSCVLCISLILILLKMGMILLLTEENIVITYGNVMKSFNTCREKICLMIWNCRYKKQGINPEKGWFFPHYVSVINRVILLGFAIFRIWYLIKHSTIYTYNKLDMTRHLTREFFQISYPVTALLLEIPALYRLAFLRRLIKTQLSMCFCYTFKSIIFWFMTDPRVYFNPLFAADETTQLDQF